MTTRKNPKKVLGSCSHAPSKFSYRIWTMVNSFGSRDHQMKSCFSRRWFFINNFFDVGDTKIKITPSCSSSQAGSKHILSDLARSIWISDLWSGQAKIRSMSGHDPCRSICTPSEAARRAKSFGTICTSVYSSCRDLLAKNGLWRHLTTGDLPVIPDRQLHPRSAQMGWAAMIPKEVGGFDRFVRNGKDFHISP